MNQRLLRLLIESRKDFVLEKSCRDCHVWGVDSLVLDDSDKMIRMYVARSNHELWKNYYKPTSVAIHPHHCDLTLNHVYGGVFNISYIKSDKFNLASFRRSNNFKIWQYDSKLRNGKGSFEEKGYAHLYCSSYKKMNDGEKIQMNAYELHTMFVPEKELAAWIVEEGVEDKDYQPICYSNEDLQNFNSEGMYGKMDEAYLDELLEELEKAI